MSRKITFLTLVILFFVFNGLIYFYLNHKIENQKPQVVKENVILSESKHQVTPVPFPDSVSFAGESLPLDLFYVREQLERELTVNTYWHSATILIIKRAARWLPVIEPILKKNNIPDDFKYLAMIESGLLNVVSPSGATGFWQFLDKTAREYGMEVNKEVDMRYDVVASTELACKYVQEAYSKFGNWTLAAASYNMGQNGMKDRLGDQKESSYYNMAFSDETSRYIYRILAMKIIYEDQEKYHFQIPESDLYKPLEFRTIEVKESIRDLSRFAHQHDLSYKLLKEFNPWLRTNKLTIRGGKRYQIAIPLPSK